MKKTILLTSCFMIALSACNNPKKSSGIDLSNLDATVKPSEDFYQYACGGWMAANPMKPEHSRYGAFDKLTDVNVEQVKTLVQELAGQQSAAGSVGEKIAILYNMGMDSLRLNEQGAEPLRPMLETIAGLKSLAEINTEITALHKQGIHPFFGVFSEADFTNSKMNIAWLFQSGLGMGERDYYLENDDRSKEIRTKYVEMLANMFRLSGYELLVNSTPEKLAQDVLALETRMATAFMNRHDMRDPYKMFNKRNFDELVKMAPAFDFKAHFAALGLPDVKSLNIGQPEYIQAFNKILTTTKPEDIKAYLAWNVIRGAADYLSDDFVNEGFNFYGRVMSGSQELRPRWKRVVENVNGSLGEAVGQMYVAKYFPPESKENMLLLVANLQEVLGERIQAATWMNDTTKIKALEKLKAFRVKIGYPDKWRDYSGLEIKDDSYMANALRSNEFEMKYTLAKVDKPTDVDEWGMTPQTTNAYYNPTTNEICFPAGILQPPFYFANADNAVNYGGIGVVIGHEMTHGFDDQGRQYDKEGNLTDWWLPADAENFKNRAQVLVDHFNKIEVAPGVFADGQYTLGENIADNGGIQIAYQAMEKAKAAGEIAGTMDGFTPEQRFFLAYAGLWAGNIRDEEVLRLTKLDVHSLGRWRVDGTLPHIPAFLQAFDIQPGDKMYLAPEKQAEIW